MHDFVYGDEANEDRGQIWLYYEGHAGVEAADDFIDRLDDTIRHTILRLPNSGRSRPELGIGVGSYPILPYIVFYRFRDRRLEILRVLHAHRDIQPPLMSLLVAAV